MTKNEIVNDRQIWHPRLEAVSADGDVSEIGLSEVGSYSARLASDKMHVVSKNNGENSKFGSLWRRVRSERIRDQIVDVPVLQLVFVEQKRNN